jgi:hypothetical protein
MATPILSFPLNKISITFSFACLFQDGNSLEPTLQAALLKKDTFGVFFRVGIMLSKGELKGMDCENKKRRNRSTKEREIKQHQVTYLLNIDIKFSIAFFRYFG